MTTETNSMNDKEKALSIALAAAVIDAVNKTLTAHGSRLRPA